MFRTKMFLLALLTSLSACITTPPTPPPPTPQPPPVTWASNVSIYDDAGARVEDAVCDLNFDRDSGEPAYSLSREGWRQVFVYEEPTPVHTAWGATLSCTSATHVATDHRFDPLPHGELLEGTGLVMNRNAAAAGERGPLHVSGVRFLDQNDQDWRYAGFTLFVGVQQQCNGVNLDPQVDPAIADGANAFRIVGMYKPYLGTFTLAVDDPARFDACLLQTVRYLAAKGARAHLVVFADAQEVMPDNGQQQAWFVHVQHLVANEWNVIGSLCNECKKNGVDTSRFVRPSPMNKGLVLWSRGSGLGGADPENPAWDFAEYHERRGDEYPRYDECRPYMMDGGSPVKGVPCIQDEPMGASEVNQPGKRAGAINGDATQAINDFRQMGANFGLNGPGGLFHSDAGLTGSVMGTVQRAMSQAFFQGLKFAPPAAHTWLFQRGDNCRGGCQNIGGMPLEQWDAFQLRSYCRGNGVNEWCVEIRPKRAPIAISPWGILDQPGLGLVFLGR